MTVTPDSLTDDQIVEAMDLKGRPAVSFRDAWFATSDEPDSERKRECRQRIADAINARAKAGAK